MSTPYLMFSENQVLLQHICLLIRISSPPSGPHLLAQTYRSCTAVLQLAVRKIVGAYTAPTSVMAPYCSRWPEIQILDSSNDNQAAVPSMENFRKEEADKADSQDENRVLVPSSLTVVFNTNDSRTEESPVPRTGNAPTFTISHIDDNNNRVSELASQVETLLRKVRWLSSLATLGPRPMVQNGTWHTLDVRSCSPSALVPHTQERVEFPKPFKSVPTVTVGIQSADLSITRNFRVGTGVSDVDEKGFTIHVDNWDAQGASLYSCGVSWIAIAD
ncbi:hypothetical protein F5Y03DRAFT_393814 [Xylaria venustula]|nr:hypothetical protein F5Y03DRAFT_393814 [Xylaria venustula]